MLQRTELETSTKVGEEKRGQGGGSEIRNSQGVRIFPFSRFLQSTKRFHFIFMLKTRACGGGVDLDMGKTQRLAAGQFTCAGEMEGPLPFIFHPKSAILDLRTCGSHHS